MPIASQYRKNQIQPGVVDFHGVVLIEDGSGTIDQSLSVTPGVIWTRTGVGQYLCTFRSGTTVGHVAATLTPIAAAPSGSLLMSIRVIGGASLLGGPSSFPIEIVEEPSAPVDPAINEGFCYHISVSNSTVKVL